MNLKLTFYGQTTELVNSNQLDFHFNKTSLKDLSEELEIAYPVLTRIECKLAVNNRFENGGLILKDNDEISILPPFSGG